MKNGKNVLPNLLLSLAFTLLIFIPNIAGQTVLKTILPGKSTTVDSPVNGSRTDSQKYVNRYHHSNLLMADGYTAESVAYVSKPAHSIRKSPTDITDLYIEKAFTLTVLDVNEVPTDIALSNSTVAENQPSGTLVGTLTTSDPDAGDTHSYTLEAGDGDEDNTSFTISENQLLTAASFNYETKSSFSIRIRTTDALDESFEKVFIITVTNANESPTDITLSNTTIAEDLPINTVVGIFSTTDPDAGNGHTYTLVSGTGDADNSSFTISDNQLRSGAVFDYETKSSYSIRVRSTDNGTLFFEEEFIIAITSANQAPTDITLSATSIPENQPLNTVVGTLTAADPNAGDSHEFTLVSGAGSTDNGSFNIAGNQLRINGSFDFETKASYAIRIRATDLLDATFEKQFTITVTNANESPTDIALSNTTIAENLPINTVVGIFSTTDPDAGNSHTYTLVSGTGGADNSSFNISGNQLRSNAVFDYETKSSYSIRVRSTDNGTLFYDEAFTIAITSSNEAPTDISLSSTTIQENQPANTVVGTLSATDPNAGDTHVFTLVPGEGSTDNGSFNIVGNQLRANSAFNFETKSSYAIRIRATDLLGGAIEVEFKADDPDLANLQPGAEGLNARENEDPVRSVMDKIIHEIENYVFLADNDVAVLHAHANHRTSNQKTGNIYDTGFNNGRFDAVPTGRVGDNIIMVGMESDAGLDYQYASGSPAVSFDAGQAVEKREIKSDPPDNNFSDNRIPEANQGNLYSLRVSPTDIADLYIEKAFIVSVLNVNEVPTDIALSNSTVAENQPSGTLVGTLSTTDPDAGDSHTYSMVAGTGDDDNSSFTIVTNQLRTNATFNFETKSSYTVRIRTTDAADETFDEAFVITITDANEAPTDIALSSNTIAENLPVNTVIGNLTATDPDGGETHTYALVSGTGSTDNISFNISGNQLRSSAMFDFETKSSFSVRIRVTDAGTATYDEVFTITVTNLNENPTDIALSNSEIAENQPVNTVIGNLSTTDPDAGNTHTYTLVTGTGSADNGSFNIAGNQLRSDAIFDYETKSSYLIRIRTTDNGTGSLFYEEAFVITVSFANLAPTDITLSATSIPENQPVNSVVGTLTATDPNAGDSHLFTLAPGAGDTDNGSFNIAGNQLRINGPFDFETKASYAIRIRATDALSATFEKQFTITVTNTNDTPTDILLSNQEIAENLPINTVIGNLLTTDPDAGDTHGYTLVSGTGSTDNASFNIAGNQLRSSAVFDVETKATYSIRVRTTDNGTGNLFFEKIFIITVTNVNEAPLLDNMEATTLAYDEGEGIVFVTATVTVADIDNTTLASAVIQITSGFNTTEDRLRYTAADGITGSFNTTSGILNLSGAATLLQYRAALRRVGYENINTVDPATVTRVVSFTVNDGELASNTVTRNISINSANTAPVLDNIETTALIYCTKPGALPVTSTLTVSDIDNDTLSSATVRIITGLIASEDRLLFTAQHGITGTYTPATGILALTGLDNLANYQAALRSVRYENINLVNPATTGRAISFTVNDGTDNSNAEARNITVNGAVRGILSGSQTICDDGYSTASLSLNLSGNSPWTFTVRRNVSNDTTYTGIISDPFTIQGRVIGTSPTTYRIIAISDANCEGDTASGTVKVSYLTPNSPRAVISGVDTICPGDPAMLNVALVGTAPWSITYLRDGANPTVVNNILNSNYNLVVTNGGTYTLSRVSDIYCTGKVSGSGIVRLYSVPTATISGSSVPICEHTATNLSVALTGSSPWKFSYKIGPDTIDVLNVGTSPRLVSVKKGGVYTLTEVFDKFCKGTVAGNVTINVLPAPDVTLSGLAPAYNSTTNWIPVYGDPEGGSFTGPALFEVRDTMFFFPSIAGVGTHEIIYQWLSPINLCYGYDTTIVRVLTANADIIFPGDKTFYCFNDAPFIVTGVNTANFTGSFTISGGIGLLDNGNNTATITPALLEPGVYEITYTYFDEAMLQVKEFFTIGNKPVADFTWEGECFHAGQPISFKDKSLPNEGTIVAYKWLFHNSTGYDSLVTKDAAYTYGSPGNYRVDLQIRTSYGCTDSLERTLGLRPTVRLLAGDNYFEDFEGSPVGWMKDNAASPNVNSWVLDIPVAGFSGHEQGENCWFTLITSTNAPREVSWVTSPCFDFTETETPMLKMNIWRLFNGLRDGAVLQASADSGKSWQNVGQWRDGINWFNETGILGTPGGQPIGWANARDNDWIESRHSLDVFRNKKEVQFRFAYGSDGTARDTDGIAFDNFWIGERNRIALVEHFTNASDDKSATANQQLNTIVNEDTLSLIDLQYHTTFPGDDPFSGHDPFSTGTRVLYYGFSTVPYAVLNGGSISAHRFDYENSPLNANTMLVESLLPSLFQININANRSGNALNAEVELLARQVVPLRELTIHIAVIERVIRGVTGNNGETEFESVVKTLLPDAAGTTLYRSWAVGDPHSLTHEWEIHDVYNEDELRVVAFIQDESTHEVYQAAIDTISILSDIDDHSPGNLNENAFVVFPNPAARIARLRFHSPVKKEVRIELYNSLGSLVFNKEMPEGTDETEIAVEDLPDGIYLIRIIDSDTLIGIGKLTVSK